MSFSPTLAERFAQTLRTRLATEALANPATQAVLLRRLLAVVQALEAFGPQAVVPTAAPWPDAAALTARWRDGRALVVATRCPDSAADSRLTLYRHNEITFSISVGHEQLPAAVARCLSAGGALTH
ncbi:hypothetical protein [Hymenobacter sp. B81]|uniref:hypothetical protein n=1 Tax=Hymenobacter sp. B81 TaxID=3344878 RepID=UPI0037DC011F